MEWPGPLSSCLIWLENHRIVKLGKALQAQVQHWAVSLSATSTHLWDTSGMVLPPLPWAPVPGLDHCSSEDIFTKISLNLPNLGPFPLSVVPSAQIVLMGAHHQQKQGEDAQTRTHSWTSSAKSSGTVLKTYTKPQLEQTCGFLTTCSNSIIKNSKFMILSCSELFFFSWRKWTPKIEVMS